MYMNLNLFLISGSVLTATAALLHVGCILFGVKWYRFFGAGQKMIRLIESGSDFPAKLTCLIALGLLAISVYALAGAGVITALPLQREVLCVITAIFLMRGFGFILLMKVIPGNSLVFWLVSSGICALIGLLHLVGTVQTWPRL